jgi:hypothetical protein
MRAYQDLAAPGFFRDEGETEGVVAVSLGVEDFDLNQEQSSCGGSGELRAFSCQIQERCGRLRQVRKGE